jgi:ribokinase
MIDHQTPLDVLVAGELFVDLILSGFKFWPRLGQEAFARHFHREIGGGAAITACGLAKLGLRVGVLGAVGTDAGEWVTEQFKTRSVDTSAIRLDCMEPTAFTVVASLPEDRAFLSYPGANRLFAGVLAEAAARQHLYGARHVHLACSPRIDTTPDVLSSLRDTGCSLSLDVGWHEDWLKDPGSLAKLPLIDLFFPNEVEAMRMTGEGHPEQILRCFALAGVKRVALKLGARGAALLWDGEMFFIGPHPVTPLDSTGAGDCFDAGFLYAWLKGESPETCLRTANVCGALSTEAFGGIAGFPSPEHLERELEIGRCEK